MPLTDYYEVLGVSRTSDQEVIRAAYKAMILKYHPDTSTSPGAAEKAKQINEAFAILGDPDKRRQYDAARAHGGSGSPTPHSSFSSPAIACKQPASKNIGAIQAIVVGAIAVIASVTILYLEDAKLLLRELSAATSEVSAPKDLATITALAEGGDAEAQMSLGKIYEDGEGVKQDHTAAVSWFRKAADLGNANAMAELALKYHWGQGIAKDDVAYLKWMRKSAQLGNSDAMSALGYLYETGNFVTQDYTLAANWYLKAANLGDNYSQNKMGEMYQKGWGVRSDLVKAHMWYNISAANSVGSDRDERVADRNLITTFMSSAEIAQAQILARDWQPAQE